MGHPSIHPALARFVLLLALHAGAQTNVPPRGPGGPQMKPEQRAQMPVVALPVAEMKLLMPATGWVLAAHRILVTTDRGANWKDISPPNPEHDNFADVFFLNAKSGWVLVAHDDPDDASIQTLRVAYTEDGGTTWSNGTLPAWGSGAGPAGTGILAFATRRRGWLSLNIQGNTLFAASELLSTADGGRTWNWAKHSPDGEIEAMTALTERDLWILDRSEEVRGLFRTGDGGRSFQRILITAPKSIPADCEPNYEPPVFSDRLHGYEVVTYSGPKSAAVLFATRDGGRTWTPDRILSNLAENSVGDVSRSTVAGSIWMFSFGPRSNQPALLKLLPKSGVTDAAGLRLNNYTCSLSFLSPEDGWRNCSGKLQSTGDGGATWADITPRVRNGVLTVDPITPKITRIPPRTTISDR